MAQAMEIYIRHAMLFILQSHCEIRPFREVQENQLMTREGFVLPFQGQNPPNDFLATPQIVEDTSRQVAEVDGPDEQVMYSESSFVSGPTPVLDWAAGLGNKAAWSRSGAVQSLQCRGILQDFPLLGGPWFTLFPGSLLKERGEYRV